MGYEEMRCYHNDMAAYVLDSNADRVSLPSHFDPSQFTSSAIDNFDHESGTLYDASCHDTVSTILYLLLLLLL